MHIDPLGCCRTLGPFSDGSWAARAGFPSHSYPANTDLAQQGAPSDSVYTLAEGRVKITHLHIGGELTILAVCRRGEILAAADVIQKQPYAATAATLTRCLVHRIPAKSFRVLLRHNAGLSWYVHCMHSRELREQQARGDELGALRARERLVRFLKGQATQPSSKGARLDIGLRMWEVARLISVSPPYLSKLLRDLESDGLLRREKGWLFLLDCDPQASSLVPERGAPDFELAGR